tara:strand:+ start:15788 stop:22423 length:6636 start_codon:yes stop_codon:yes gene_type:complete
MEINFCNDITIKNRYIKCISIKEKVSFHFINIYFLENNFQKNDEITWHSNKKNGYGIISEILKDSFKIKDKDTGNTFDIPRYYINKIHPIHKTIQKIETNINQKEKNPFKNINTEDIQQLENYINIPKKNIIDELFPFLEQGYSSKFIFDEMINEDDTNEITLMKISQRCCSCDFESYKYIYATYYDTLLNKYKPIGFDYESEELLSSEDLLSEDLCELLQSEKHFTDESNETIINHTNKLLNLFENNKLNNTIFFIGFNDFIESKNINSSLINDSIDCSEIQYELKTLKNRIINKYWPHLRKYPLSTIVGETEEKKKEHEIDRIKLKNYSFGNKIIYGHFIQTMDESPIACDNIEITYFRLNKSPDTSNKVNLHKLFSDFKLDQKIPFMKWIGSTYDNKYYKIHKDSMIYEGHDILRNENKTIDIHLCQEWTNDFYRSESTTLEEMNRFDNLHKTDVLLFKVCSVNQFIYSTLVIHLNGDIELIIKRNKNDTLSISSKQEIKDLIINCNSLIDTINKKNIYSNNIIIDFGTEEEIDTIFEKDTINNTIDFLDYNVFYHLDKYEVKKGISQKEYDQLSKTDQFNPFSPPFIRGDRTSLFIPLLKNLMKNLPMYFRYMVENNKEENGILSGHYKRVNNYAKTSSIQSAISAYSNIGNLEPEEIINILSKEFSKEKSEMIEEYESWKIMIKRKMESNITIKNTTIIEEDGANITITLNNEFLRFNIRNAKSFLEFERILIIIKTMMSLFNNYINQTEILDDSILSSLFETNPIEIDDFTPEKEKKIKQKLTFKDLLDTDSEDSSDSDSEDDSEDDSDSEDDIYPSDDEPDMKGGGGKYDVRSYYLKRLKENDKKLFVFKSEKFQTDKRGNTTNTRYGYPKICQAAKGLGSRQPISITEEELARIDNSYDLGSGKESYSYAIDVPGRSIINSKKIKYICPQYWDVSKQLSIRKDYVNKNHMNDIIPEVLPKDGRSDKFILKRQGTFWDGIPENSSYKYFVPRLLENTGIHPDGYPLPCCFSLAKNKQKVIDDKISYEKIKKQPKQSTTPDKQLKCKINTKSIGPLNPGQCSHLPKTLLQLLKQDLILKYDPELTISNGFIRKGVLQNQGKHIFSTSSFINSFIEITEYKKTHNDFIQEELIQPLENNIRNFQICHTLQRRFKKHKVFTSDLPYILTILKKKETRITFGPTTIQKMITIIEKYNVNRNQLVNISFDSNKKNYIYHLILSLKSYIDYLKSSEEKQDEYIIPLLNILQPINIIIFEKINEKITLKQTNQTDSDEFCFIYKDTHYYEPIIYRVNLLKSYDIKIFSEKIFSTFTIISKEDFIQFLKTPYPRGRKEELRSGLSKDKIKNIKCNEKQDYCKLWLSYKEYTEFIGKPKNGLTIKWNESKSDKCNDSGKKYYSTIKNIVNGTITTKENKKIPSDKIFIQNKNRIIDPKLIQLITDQNNWSWIDKGCSNIYDKDIEALFRKKYDPKGDKLLLEYSNTKFTKEKKSEETKLLFALKSHFFIINKILNDLSNSSQKPPEITIPLQEYTIKEYIINHYSEVCFLIAKKKDSTLTIPIVPTQLPFNNKIKINYTIDEPPHYDQAIHYLKKLNLTIQSLIQNESGITTILLTNGSYLPVLPHKLTKLQGKYNIIESNCPPLTIDNTMYTTNVDDTMKNYIKNYNSKNTYKELLFNHILNLINTKYISLQGTLQKEKTFTLGQSIYFQLKNKTILPITKNEYYKLFHTLNLKKLKNKEYNIYEYPFYGKISEISNDLITVQCSLSDKIYHIIRDKITIKQHKINNLLNIIYNNDSFINDGLTIHNNDIFHTINDEQFNKKNINELVEYTKNGSVLKNPSLEDKKDCKIRIFIKKSILSSKYDIKLIQEFIHKLIIHIENGTELRFVNRLSENVINSSFLEKTTSESELFYKYNKDKDTMKENLHEIFTKKSEFINQIFPNEIHPKYKHTHTNKLKLSPYYINRLYGLNSTLIFNIDTMGDDWYSIINAFKQLKINLRFIKSISVGIEDKYKYIGDIQKLIIYGLNKITNTQDITNTINEYNHYHMIHNKDFEPFTTIDDIKQYWILGKNKKINIPDLKIILQEIEEYYQIDLGILIITLNKQKKNDIHFYHTKNIYNDTPILSFHHTLYKNEIILANISKNNKLSLTVQELYNISEDHKTWIHPEKIGIRPCEKQKLIIQQAQERIEERNRLNDLDKEVIQSTESTYCEE